MYLFIKISYIHNEPWVLGLNVTLECLVITSVGLKRDTFKGVLGVHLDYKLNVYNCLGKIMHNLIGSSMT